MYYVASVALLDEHSTGLSQLIGPENLLTVLALPWWIYQCSYYLIGQGSTADLLVDTLNQQYLRGEHSVETSACQFSHRECGYIQ